MRVILRSILLHFIKTQFIYRSLASISSLQLRVIMSSVTNSEELVYGIRLSTVVPARVTGDGKVHDLNSIDLAMKLHYLKAIYFFTNTTTSSEGNNSSTTTSFVNIYDFKNRHLFDWLETYFVTCGRVRIPSEEGVCARPVIKLNDAGIRIVEAQASKTVEEWLAMEKFASLNDQLIYNHVLGPDLGFTPLVFIQVTWFKCGGVSVGLSWAHILGDAFSATTFMNELGHYLRDHQKPPMILGLPEPLKPKYPTSAQSQEPLSIKRVSPVGDCWVAPNNCKMGTHSFHLTRTQLDELHSTIHGPKRGDKNSAQYFELISAIFWKSLAKIRKEMEPKVVTICRPKSLDRAQVIPYNGQVIGTVKAQSKVSTSDVVGLESLIVESMVDESEMFEEFVEKEMSGSDFVVFGANLTFLDMEEADVYGFELKGQRPVFASYSVNGFGDEGVIVVLPGPNEGTKFVMVTLPQHEIEKLKVELKKEWTIASNVEY